MRISRVIVILLLLASFIHLNMACGENDYVSMSDIQKNTPSHWINTYNTADGRAVSINIPILLPDVEKVPIIRVGWGGPYEISDDSALVEENEKNHLIAEFKTVSQKNVTQDEAPATYIQNLKSKVPSISNIDFENYMLVEENSEQEGHFFRMAFYSCFHGIPYLIDGNYRADVPSEHIDELPAVPSTTSVGGLADDHFGITLCSPKEIEIQEDDIPLLPFENIITIFEKWISDGYVYSLDEMRFGYMAFIGPEQKGESFVLIPVWAAKGITRGTTNMPFYPDEDPDSLMFTAYKNPTVCVVNAQTGEKYDFVDNARENRRYVPHILSWSEVK